MKITREGKYQTRDGRPVRILATDLKAGALCIVGAVLKNGGETVDAWTSDGRGSPDIGDSSADLVPSLTKHEGWVVMEMTTPLSDIRVVADGSLFESKKDAQFYIDYMFAYGAMPVYIAWED